MGRKEQIPLKAYGKIYSIEWAVCVCVCWIVKQWRVRFEWQTDLSKWNYNNTKTACFFKSIAMKKRKNYPDEEEKPNLCWARSKYLTSRRETVYRNSIRRGSCPPHLPSSGLFSGLAIKKRKKRKKKQTAEEYTGVCNECVSIDSKLIQTSIFTLKCLMFGGAFAYWASTFHVCCISVCCAVPFQKQLDSFSVFQREPKLTHTHTAGRCLYSAHRSATLIHTCVDCTARLHLWMARNWIELPRTAHSSAIPVGLMYGWIDPQIAAMKNGWMQQQRRTCRKVNM